MDQPSEVIRQLSQWSCELRLAWARIGVAGRSARDLRGVLRTLLRDVPWWTRGHLELGAEELRWELLSREPRNLRAVGAIEIAATAAARITRLDLEGAPVGEEGPAGNRRIVARALYLLGAASFLRGRHQRAAALFRRLFTECPDALEPADASQALELAGGSAMALGELREAQAFFAKIPAERRSGDVDTALRYLEGALAE